jgi:hypothetical protein
MPDSAGVLTAEDRQSPICKNYRVEHRRARLQTAATIFDLVYEGECAGFVLSAARADRAPRPRDHDGDEAAN